MKTRLLALCAAATCASFAVEQSACAFEMKAWRNTVPFGTAGNAVFSPVGFSITTAVLGEGMGGSARVALMDSIGLVMDFSSVGTSHQTSHEAANASNRVEVSVATSLWTTRRKAIGREYQRTIQQGFDAEAGYLRDIYPVNAWTEAKTDGRISNVLTAIPKNVDTIVINAVAFEGAWDRPFDEAFTKKSSFTRADGSKVSIPMMRKECEMLVLDEPRFRMCQLDFAAPGYSMLMVLPKKGITLAKLRERDVTDKTMDGFKSILRARMGNGLKEGVAEFSMPVFEIRSEWNLVDALRAAKVPRKGFERIGEGPFTIDNVRQFVYFKVTEAGYSLTPGFMPDMPQRDVGSRRSELSAASEEEGDGKSLPRLGAPIVCNRSFLFFVWDKNTDSFIIAGQFTGGDDASNKQTDKQSNKETGKPAKER